MSHLFQDEVVKVSLVLKLETCDGTVEDFLFHRHISVNVNQLVHRLESDWIQKKIPYHFLRTLGRLGICGCDVQKQVHS